MRIITEITIFGTMFKHNPKLENKKVKLNNFEYTEPEVLDALIKKGYTIVEWIDVFPDETFPNGITWSSIKVNCAILPGEQPSENNVWYKVAQRIFNVTKKPELI